MKIKKLITVNWGTIGTREWPFGDTVLLTGESGSGKSSLLDAIQTLLTAAHHHLVQYNIGQDESTQTGRGGKEPRTLGAYALGQQNNSGLFIRQKATSFVAAVLVPSKDEDAKVMTIITGVDAEVDGGKAKVTRTHYFIIRRELELKHFLDGEGTTTNSLAIPLKRFYTSLQMSLQATADVIQRYEEKTGYLNHLYGAFLGKVAVSDKDAQRAARSIVRAMAYKELGNVNELVRDEILDRQDFTNDLQKMRELMSSMMRLKQEAERLSANIQKLESVDSEALAVINGTRLYVLDTVANIYRQRDEAENEVFRLRREIDGLAIRRANFSRQAEVISETYQSKVDTLTSVKAKLEKSDVARQKDDLEKRLSTLRTRYSEFAEQAKLAANSFFQLLGLLNGLVAADWSLTPVVQQAVERLRPFYDQTRREWQGGIHTLLSVSPDIETDLSAFDLEAFDLALTALDEAFRGDIESVKTAVITSTGQVASAIKELQAKKEQVTEELLGLQSGRPPGTPEVHIALNLLADKIPEAEATMLAALIEPKPGSTWQNAIEGYIGNNRFSIVVKPGYESRCMSEVNRRFPQKSPRILQGTKVIAEAKTRPLESDSILTELIFDHPVASAYLRALYGRVRKVTTIEELAKTHTGLMERGMGSGGYSMYSCREETSNLAFGQDARKRRIDLCGNELRRLATELATQRALENYLSQALTLATRPLKPLAAPVREMLEMRLSFMRDQKTLASLDLTDIQDLIDQKASLEEEMDKLREERDLYISEEGSLRKQHGDAQEKLRQLQDFRIPALDIDETNAEVHITRFAAVCPGRGSIQQLKDEARAMCDDIRTASDTFRRRRDHWADGYDKEVREVRRTVEVYLLSARNDDERFAFPDPPKGVENFDKALPIFDRLLADVQSQISRQKSVGLAENIEKLVSAEHQFNHTFTSTFCLKVRDEIRQGKEMLVKLNTELAGIEFGYDRFSLKWDWVPAFQRFYEFFEAMEAHIDTFDRDRGSIFESPLLNEEHRKVALEIREMLLSNDQGQSEKMLLQLADYRNYRRYDIIRKSPAGEDLMSKWGQGSGGELETPFYVIRSTVLKHALGHFRRERKGAPALRLMLSDEAFSKMDESRSRAVIQFLSQRMNLQLIVAMPTAKSGAIKPEFEREYTFSKIEATRGSQTLSISEVQEKELKQDALRPLWQNHAQSAQEAARLEYEAQHQALSPALLHAIPLSPVSVETRKDKAA